MCCVAKRQPDGRRPGVKSLWEIKRPFCNRESQVVTISRTYICQQAFAWIDGSRNARLSCKTGVVVQHR